MRSLLTGPLCYIKPNVKFGPHSSAQIYQISTEGLGKQESSSQFKKLRLKITATLVNYTCKWLIKLTPVLTSSEV